LKLVYKLELKLSIFQSSEHNDSHNNLVKYIVQFGISKVVVFWLN